MEEPGFYTLSYILPFLLLIWGCTISIYIVHIYVHVYMHTCECIGLWQCDLLFLRIFNFVSCYMKTENTCSKKGFGVTQTQCCTQGWSSQHRKTPYFLVKKLFSKITTWAGNQLNEIFLLAFPVFKTQARTEWKLKVITLWGEAKMENVIHISTCSKLHEGQDILHF